ncbi:hypothetical protein [Caldivirga sp.]|uniref:hypothetical protein n=1 Tax=Caldivirga sp. TaxID=2080243 RepID=UPI0025C56256|nr:hypothetical protein [Caldivirga sp.]
MMFATPKALRLSSHYGSLVYYVVLFLTSPFNPQEFVAIKAPPLVMASNFLFQTVLTVVDLSLALLTVDRVGLFKRPMLYTMLLIITANYIAFTISYMVFRRPLIGISGIAVDSSVIALMASYMLRVTGSRIDSSVLTALSLACSIITLYLAFASPYWVNHVIDVLSLTPALTIMWMKRR